MYHPYGLYLVTSTTPPDPLRPWWGLILSTRCCTRFGFCNLPRPRFWSQSVAWGHSYPAVMLGFPAEGRRRVHIGYYMYQGSTQGIYVESVMAAAAACKAGSSHVGLGAWNGPVLWWPLLYQLVGIKTLRILRLIIARRMYIWASLLWGEIME